uniref:RING-type domain-containing protein n=1 Tax=Kalanchoe fedtschenkoi TaxID=63787 RepID=A0A7N0T0R1_KALFE
MICVMNYTVRVWILILHLTDAIQLVINFIFCPHDVLRPSAQHYDWGFCDLPSAKFRDAATKLGSDADDCCSVCLVEFDGEDEVSELAGCGHVFHGDCIRGWIERDRFTCPLCRSLLFADLHPSCC